MCDASFARPRVLSLLPRKVLLICTCHARICARSRDFADNDCTIKCHRREACTREACSASAHARIRHTYTHTYYVYRQSASLQTVSGVKLDKVFRHARDDFHRSRPLCLNCVRVCVCVFACPMRGAYIHAKLGGGGTTVRTELGRAHVGHVPTISCERFAVRTDGSSRVCCRVRPAWARGSPAKTRDRGRQAPKLLAPNMLRCPLSLAHSTGPALIHPRRVFKRMSELSSCVCILI